MNNSIDMKTFSEKFEFLKKESDKYFNTDFESEEAEEIENIRIKSSLLALINEAKNSKTDAEYFEVKNGVINYFCEICGHFGDLEILEKHASTILSTEDFEYVIQNSALSRWF